MPSVHRTTVLTLRVPDELDRRITAAARRRKSTKSAVLREAIDAAFGKGPTPDDPAREARRQSLLASSRPSEQEALGFVADASDDTGWS